MVYGPDPDWNDSYDHLEMIPKLTLKGADLDEMVERFLEWKSDIKIAINLSGRDERALFGQLDEPYRREPLTYERACSLYSNMPSFGTPWASSLEPKGTDIDIPGATAETTLTAEQRAEWKRWSKQEHFAQVVLAMTVHSDTYTIVCRRRCYARDAFRALERRCVLDADFAAARLSRKLHALQAQTPVTPKRLQDHFRDFIHMVYRLGELGHPLSDGFVCNLFLSSVPGEIGERLNVAFVTLPEEKKTKDHLDVLVDNQVCILRMSSQRERERQKERRR